MRLAMLSLAAQWSCGSLTSQRINLTAGCHVLGARTGDSAGVRTRGDVAMETRRAVAALFLVVLAV